MATSSHVMTMSPLPPINCTIDQKVSSLAICKYDALTGLTGPTYTLNGIEHHLPPPSMLKPYKDRQTGNLVTWPAHASAQAASGLPTTLANDRSKAMSGHRACQRSRLAPKPHFLQQLEAFLERELVTLKVTGVMPSELRLQAHREVFEYLIEDFKTYRPLLAAIKNEYEMMLSLQREQLRHLEPLQQMLVTVSSECDQKIMALQETEKEEMAALRESKRSLYREIERIEGERLSLATQVSRLQEELSSEYLRYRDESDARKLLVSDINDLMYQAEDQAAAQRSVDSLDGGNEGGDDPVILRLALKRARDDGNSTSRRLLEMEANYCDVIPRRDHEALQKQMQEYLANMELVKEDFLKLKNEHDVLLDVHKQVIQQRDDYYVECEKLRRSATPRPDWAQCADVIAGGMERWKQLADSKTSEELVHVLLDEISGGGGQGTASGPDFFEAKGMDDTVPKFLHSEEPVRNRHIGKRDCMLLIQEIWREKALKDAKREDGSNEKLSDFIVDHLRQTYALPLLVTEWGYNLNDACYRYAHDPYIGLFGQILTGEADEQLYHEEVRMVTRVLHHVTRADEAAHGGAGGALGVVEMHEALATCFPLRASEHIAEMLRAAQQQLETMDSETVAYRKLFTQDDDLKTGPFLEVIKRQFLEDRMKYVDDIIAELTGLTEVSVEAVKKAFTSTDPEIEQADLDRYLTWLFGVSDKAALASAPATDVDTLRIRLRTGNIRRLGTKS